MSKARSHEGQEAPGWSLDFYFKYNGSHWKALAYLVAQMVKKKKKSACNAGDLGSIPGLCWEDCLEK